MAKIDKRFQILLSEEEQILLKNEAKRRGVSQGELVRMALKNEIIQKSELLKRQAVVALSELLD
ncbi:CopG family transcriptional regulator [Leptospira sp. 2 VSF19]|uniref:CopG family transcriptional regulator n=1 Tax=Leptospira soteropolitanensis TaxID=2950025 RepID=A0AAW5VLU4_9LEPT|nr:CopG family transcriptional regulator [Leptospira soteropolitanensis]MCW7493703.1 CopG family transcriptional regulator [Leptospira soteropolitanensis]MCW7501301.1 CopG family transcriptional regulator [Leptospira soteropolitanensis]MCW7523513.1 CopG family transcriptional regulator [Leptospira soteropolitanensis]MCW7527415.1 CopG family transcriptional regulator [Leptospira soteropolitanensis]MCW7531271.1 CopG family transcriptional regulator [Leptospira soteropolitanensis]